MPYLGQQRVLLPGVQSSDLTTGKVKSGRGKDALAEGGMDAIATFVVPSGGLASITFAGIPSGYRSIEIRTAAKSSRTDAPYSFINGRVNGDSSSNYSVHEFFADGRPYVTVGGYASQTSFEVAPLAGSYSGMTGMYSVSITRISDYDSTTKAKTIFSKGGYTSNTVKISNIGGYVGYLSAAWLNTSAPISTITFYDTSGSFVENSHFALYGIK
jgi:hypothetical protein